MAAEINREIELEIGHVLFIDLVGYSKLLINEQSEVLHELNDVVRETERVRAAAAADKLIRLPAGDGMALVFRDSPEGQRSAPWKSRRRSRVIPPCKYGWAFTAGR